MAEALARYSHALILTFPSEDALIETAEVCRELGAELLVNGGSTAI